MVKVLTINNKFLQINIFLQYPPYMCFCYLENFQTKFCEVLKNSRWQKTDTTIRYISYILWKTNSHWFYPVKSGMWAVSNFLPPATKLGQGYIFTDVCGGSGPRGCLVLGWRGCLLPGGCLLQGGHLVPGGGLVETPPGRLLLRVVCILLECILVSMYSFSCLIHQFYLMIKF